ncbi:MAG: helix-turn-helix transcriptional regulator [Clostridia bacterium]|nr:helix-turn-helix transcriptional regulator [Clostridia bacterium]
MEPVCKKDREGQIIRERRIELGLTQEQVAIEIGMSLQQYPCLVRAGGESFGERESKMAHQKEL